IALQMAVGRNCDRCSVSDQTLHLLISLFPCHPVYLGAPAYSYSKADLCLLRRQYPLEELFIDRCPPFSS
ncbi:hypothetical protein M422DRAFT_35144, partial [Sphaerobolus stellatus SS14]